MADNYLNKEFYFSDPRLKMTLAGRFLVRVLALIVFLVLLISSVIFIFSQISSIRWAGILLFIFVIDYMIHRSNASRSIGQMPKDKKVNLNIFFLPKSFNLVERAYDKGLLQKTDFYLELLLQLLESGEIRNGLKRLDVDPESFKQKTEEVLKSSTGQKLSQNEFLRQIEELAVEAFARAAQNGSQFIRPQELFSALANLKDENNSRIFSLFSINSGDLERALIFDSVSRKILGWRSLPSAVSGFVRPAKHSRHRIMNRAWTSRPTPALDRYSVDFTDLARQGESGFLIGHQGEYNRLIDAISRPINPNALLIGEPSIGKEALISHLAYQIVNDKVPSSIFDKRLVGIQIADLVAGAKPEELQTRIQKIVQEIFLAGNIILYIPEIHNLIKTSGEAYLSAADALMPIIRNNSFPIIGSTYPREFKEYIEPRTDFLDIFDVIRVAEISETDAEKLLVYESLLLEAKTKIIISFKAIKEAVILAKKYMHEKFLPASAEDLLKDALMEAKRNQEKVLTADRVINVAEEKTKIPIHQFSSLEAGELLNLESIIHERLIDQEEAVKSVSQALREYRSGLVKNNGPIASFLFVGPTGVGKTELSKILAKIQFGNENLMIRFDMSEYQDKQSFYRFIGSPDGQISGMLTEAVMQKPYSLVLFDEFEKAYPDILNLFLQVLDDGRLTDNFGRTVDFKNTIIIATSNAHSDIINESLRNGETMEQIAGYLKTKLVDVFKPELLNRFSKIIIFKELSMDDVSQIAELNLKDLADIAQDQGITLSFDPAAVKKIAQLGYNPAFGARPLRQVVNEKLRAPLSEEILKGKVAKGSSVKVNLSGDDFQFTSQA
ncbi:MAG: ATP-dependent Clp protease ATP-binding subunit [Patescibacteria group bacterium]|nr:ATP-dependent Clp protease ATP-binding subunit [Patescibacteria group bacterium]